MTGTLRRRLFSTWIPASARHTATRREQPTTVTLAAPATIPFSCSTSLEIWNGVPCAPAMSTAPMTGKACLKPVVVRYKGRKVRLYFRGDAAFASPEMYEYLEAEGFLYAIRLPKNQILQESITHLLSRPVGRPPNHVRRYYASFSYQAGSWDRKRRVVAKVEWHPGELVPRVGFIVTNLSRPAERVVALLQSTRQSGAVHQGRQVRHQMDPAVMWQVPQ